MAKPNRAGNKDNSIHVEQRDKIKDEFYIKERYRLSEKQQKIVSAGLDKNTKCLILDGCAGTSKTYLAIYIALKLLNSKKTPEITYIRTLVQSKDGETGFLTGNLDEKTFYYNIPFYDKLEEFLNRADLEKLKKENRLKTMPSSMMRGLGLSSCVIFDECQNALITTTETVMTRMNEHSLLILCGDSSGSQNDLGQKSGFGKICEMFNNEKSRENGVEYFQLDEDDVVRSKFVKFVIESFKEINKNNLTKNTNGIH